MLNSLSRLGIYESNSRVIDVSVVARLFWQQFCVSVYLTIILLSFIFSCKRIAVLGEHIGLIRLRYQIMYLDELIVKSCRELRQMACQGLPIRAAGLHNLKHVNVDIPLGIMTVITGVAGSGKSTLISQVFARQYENDVVMVDQGPITATNRSTPASYLGIFDEIRKLMGKENGKDEGLFSFNSKGACPACAGKGVIVTELAFMDPVITECEACFGTRFNKESLDCRYKGKNIVEILALTASEALDMFEDYSKITRRLKVMQQVGLSYLTLGQPLSTLSGGERQRIKLAKNLGKKGSIIIMDEPTTGLHMSDIENLMKLFDLIVSRGNSLVVIEHNLDVIKQADWIIDIGPDGGKNGGEVVFEGTPQDMVKHAKTLTADCLRMAFS